MNKQIYEIKGFDELQAKIKKLPDAVKKREVIKILRKSARSTVIAAKSQAPKSKKKHYLANGDAIEPGNLIKSIKVAVMRKARVPMVVVGPRSSGKYDGFYGRLFVIPGHNVYESGFVRNRKGNRASNDSNAKGSVEADPFMARAHAATKGRVSSKMQKGTEAYIQKQIDRL